MSDSPEGHWRRALELLKAAEYLVSVDHGSSVSRAYYSAFHAVTAYFAIHGRRFKKHSALRASIHRDLIHSSQWPVYLGRSYDFLSRFREVGDYGTSEEITDSDAIEAIAHARAILKQVASDEPDSFPLPAD